MVWLPSCNVLIFYHHYLTICDSLQLLACDVIAVWSYDLNGHNPHFSEQAHLQLNEADYPENADQSDQEARRVLAAEMML